MHCWPIGYQGKIQMKQDGGDYAHYMSDNEIHKGALFEHKFFFSKSDDFLRLLIEIKSCSNKNIASTN